MAKKAAAPATIEEKLKAALVPVAEQPYAVPGNWCWVRFGNLAIEMADGPFGSNLKTEHYTSKKEARIIQLSNIGDEGWREDNTKYTSFQHAETIARSIVQPGNLVIAKMMPAGRAIICPSGEAMYVLSSDAVKVVPFPELYNIFLCYSINSSYFRNLVQENTQGITRARTSIKKLKLYPFALPPLAEQRRIVDHRIETMFARLDEAKEKAQAVIDGHEDRKAAILHKAFTGELTAQIRAKKSVVLSSWKKTNLGAIVSGFKYGSSEKSDYLNTGTPVFRIPNIGDGSIDFDDMKYLSGEADETYVVHQNDVLIIRSNGSRDLVGKCAIVPRLEERYAYASFLIKIIPSEAIRPDFLVRFLNSSDARSQMFAKAKSSSGIHNINSKELGSIILKLPELWEQEQIVSIIDDLLAKEAAVKEAAETTLAIIDAMKQSILSRAFRGELGTNDPNDEPAEELLKRILA